VPSIVLSLGEMNALLDYFRSGGILMWPILLCSIASWAVMIERGLGLRRSRLMDADTVEATLRLLERGDVAGAEQVALTRRPKPSLIAAILAKGIDEFRYTSADLETALQSVADRLLAGLWKNMLLLRTIGRVSLLLGLLGTVGGMVVGFKELKTAGVEKELLAEAVSIALITTVGGLCVAIPAIIGEALHRARIDRITGETEEILVRAIKAAHIGGCTKERARASAERSGTPAGLAEAPA
jgi:biopolymer transport protein ExbB